jgi:O-antigen/teichoic acid export membrane protein
MVAPVVVWAEPITDLLLGSDYAKSAGVLRAMAPYIVLQGIGPLLAVSVNYVGAARQRVPIAIAAVVVNVVIDAVFLRRWGVVAGAVGTSVAFAVYAAGHAVVCHRLFDIHPAAMGLTLARSLLAAAAMSGVLALFGTGRVGLGWMVIGLVAGLAVYAAVLVATRELHRGDLADARGLLRRGG